MGQSSPGKSRGRVGACCPGQTLPLSLPPGSLLISASPFPGPTDGPASRGLPVFLISLAQQHQVQSSPRLLCVWPSPGRPAQAPEASLLSPSPLLGPDSEPLGTPSSSLGRSLLIHPRQVTCWGRLGHREPDVKTTGQQRWVARHSAPAWVLDPPLPPRLSLRDVPSGLASGCGSEGSMLSVGCGWRRTDRLSCQLCVGKREVPLPAGTPQDASRSRVTETLATAPYPAGHFPLMGKPARSVLGAVTPRGCLWTWAQGPGKVHTD